MGKKRHDPFPPAPKSAETVSETPAADAVRPGGVDAASGTEAGTGESSADANTGELPPLETEGGTLRQAADNSSTQGGLVNDVKETPAFQSAENPAAQGTGDPDGAGGAAETNVAGLGTADGIAPSDSHGVAGVVDDKERHGSGAGNSDAQASQPDLGDGSAAGADEGEAEADHVLTNWLGDIFAELPSRFNAAVAGEVYRSRSFPISGFAAAAAALVPYYLPDMKIDPIFSHAEAETMAAFVRDHPDAPLLAMWKQVELKHKLPATIPNNADMLALTVFHHACRAVLAYERAEAADKADREARYIPAAVWPGEQSFQVQAGGFEATGFTPR